jgi:hypothetical protein
MRSLSLASFVIHLEQALVEIHHETHKALERAGQVVEKEAKFEIGHYQDQAGPFVAWKELAAATKSDRIAHGFSENDPLLRTGDMRDTVKHRVDMTGIASGEAHIGSDSEIALYQEIGTVSIPPRSFLGGALVRKIEAVKHICGEHIVAAITGTAVPTRRIE